MKLQHRLSTVSVAQQSSAKLLEAQALDTEGEILLKLGRTEDALRCLSSAADLLANTGDTALPWHVEFQES
jgi:hypothetical protein